jgi:hypothetical protein
VQSTALHLKCGQTIAIGQKHNKNNHKFNLLNWILNTRHHLSLSRELKYPGMHPSGPNFRAHKDCDTRATVLCFRSTFCKCSPWNYYQTTDRSSCAERPTVVQIATKSRIPNLSVIARNSLSALPRANSSRTKLGWGWAHPMLTSVAKDYTSIKPRAAAKRTEANSYCQGPKAQVNGGNRKQIQRIAKDIVKEWLINVSAESWSECPCKGFPIIVLGRRKGKNAKKK